MISCGIISLHKSIKFLSLSSVLPCSYDLAAGLCSHALRSALQTKRQPTLWALLRHLRRQLWGSKLPGGGLDQPLQNLQNHPVKTGNTQAQSFTGLLYTSQNLHTNHPAKAGNLQAHPSTGLVNQKHTIPTNLPACNPLACWRNPSVYLFFEGGRARPLQLKPKIRFPGLFLVQSCLRGFSQQE